MGRLCHPTPQIGAFLASICDRILIMAAHRILIVDDQHEVRRMLSTSLRTLGPEIEVVDVPSGEEALLVASRRPVDLLISDVRLPGLSGLELMARVHKRNPELKTILITGLTDPKVRREVAEAGVTAFFYKPLEMPDFLDAVERCLGLVETFFPLPPVVEPEKAVPEAPPITLAERLADLRKAIDATAIILLDQQGEVSARAGELPNTDLEVSLLSTITDAIKADARVAEVLGMKDPESLLCVSGEQYGLYATHAGHSNAVLAIIPHTAKVDMGATGRLLTSAVKEIKTILVKNEENEQPQLVEAEKVIETVQAIEELENLPPLELPEIDAIFGQVAQQPVATTDLDAFWDSLAEQSEMGNPLDANTITFEQARKLGLAPGEEKKPPAP
jgi:CheY-like chemotaxis protein